MAIPARDLAARRIVVWRVAAAALGTECATEYCWQLSNVGATATSTFYQLTPDTVREFCDRNRIAHVYHRDSNRIEIPRSSEPNWAQRIVFGSGQTTVTFAVVIPHKFELERMDELLKAANFANCRLSGGCWVVNDASCEIFFRLAVPVSSRFDDTALAFTIRWVNQTVDALRGGLLKVGHEGASYTAMTPASPTSSQKLSE